MEDRTSRTEIMSVSIRLGSSAPLQLPRQHRLHRRLHRPRPGVPAPGAAPQLQVRHRRRPVPHLRTPAVLAINLATRMRVQSAGDRRGKLESRSSPRDESVRSATGRIRCGELADTLKLETTPTKGREHAKAYRWPSLEYGSAVRDRRYRRDRIFPGQLHGATMTDGGFGG